MAGRGRRATSTSTVATIDQANVTYYTESSVLKPINPNENSDDWPCFLLSEAAVYHRDGTLANQLHADMEGPTVVRGKLEVEEDNKRYLVNRNMKSEPLWIQIETSHNFSIGYNDESLPIVWASGLAGWFEINPSRAYLSMCNTMFEGVHLHDCIQSEHDAALEKLRRAKKKKKGAINLDDTSLDEVLFKYSLRSGDGLTLPDAYDRLHSQAIFLLSHLSQDAMVYKYLAQRSPDIVRKLAANRAKDSKLIVDSTPCPLKACDYSQRSKSRSLEIDNKKKKPIGRPKKIRPGDSSDIEMADRAGRARRGRSSGSAKLLSSQDDIIMIDSDSDNKANLKSQPMKAIKSSDITTSQSQEITPLAAACVIVDALHDVREQMLENYNEGKVKKHPNDIAAKGWQTKTYLECNIKHYNSVHDIFLYHAANLVQLLGPEWHDTMIYQWAQENASKPPIFDNISEAEILQVVRRVKKTDKSRATNGSSPRRTSEHAFKQTPQSNRPSGKAAGLRPSTGGKKRLRHQIDFGDEMDLDEDGSFKKIKKPRYFPDEEEEDDEAADQDEEVTSEEEDEETADTSAVPLTPLVIRAERLPQTQPQGHNQTWICEEPDCGYVVRAAHEEAGQNLISAHFEEHEKDARNVEETAMDRVNLAVQEGTRGHMPINHLLERIRELGKKPGGRREETELNGQPLPEPIKRSLLI
ncbi:hypothetical protein F5Y16DRAFT_358338 [Xylariaceae sp. FL0255]|nr:hypothetical protein F5Y16DRAFT_358338 [Xylariaceae sp. FL0255]